MRKYIFYVIVILILFLVYIMICNNTYDKDFKEEYIGEKEDNVVMVNYQDKSLELNNYIIGVLACEMPALFEEETLKAMSVGIRTYFYNKYLVNNEYIFNNTDQCYITNEEMKEKWGNDYLKYYDKIKNSVLSTDNEVIYYEDKVIKALYFSMSNGASEDSKYVFGEKLPYLVSVSSIWDINLKNFEVESNYSVSEFLSKLGLNDSTINYIDILSYTDSGRVYKISVNDKEFLATEFRKLLGLRSTDFTIKEEEDNISITTKGYGHGVGMSQYGANEMAKLGYSYQDILKYYYKDVEIKNISV